MLLLKILYVTQPFGFMQTCKKTMFLHKQHFSQMFSIPKKWVKRDNSEYAKKQRKR